MKRLFPVFFILTVFLFLTSCSKKEDLKPVSIGNLSFNYNSNFWTYQENANKSAPLVFQDKKGNAINVFVSQEKTYQHPLDMINSLETLISTYEDFNVIVKPTKVEVNGTTWYEYGYTFNDGTTIRKVYSRYYGKNYNSAAVTYTSTASKYDYGYDEAVKLMTDFKLTDVNNDANEAKAHEFLVGEWEVVDSGYLVLKDDGTYTWYKDKSKDKNNMHYGTYGCDVENAQMELEEGDGVYLVLFPEGLVIDGTEEIPTTYKSDYIISFDKKEDEGYQMVNMATYVLYSLIKQ